MHSPPALHDVFGESPSAREIVAVLAFGLGVAAWLMLGLHAGHATLPWWRWAIAALVITDIAAGCVANFTRSTNDFYAARPRKRWVFIAVHGHVLALAAALGADLGLALAVWAYTVAAAAVVNLLAGTTTQSFVAGLLLAVGLVWIPQCRGLAAPLLVAYSLFVLKVVYAFAVDHHRGAAVELRPPRAAGLEHRLPRCTDAPRVSATTDRPRAPEVHAPAGASPRRANAEISGHDNHGPRLFGRCAGTGMLAPSSRPIGSRLVAGGCRGRLEPSSEGGEAGSAWRGTRCPHRGRSDERRCTRRRREPSSRAVAMRRARRAVIRSCGA